MTNITTHEPRTSAPRSHKAAGWLYAATAFTFAGLMFSISLIPTSSGRTRIIYESFSSFSILTVFMYLYRPDPYPPTPQWVTMSLFLATAALYTFLLTLPFYFYFRRRERRFLALAALSIAAHLAFARFYVAPYWIHQ